MNNISFGQLLILLIIGFLFFGDLTTLTKNITNFIKRYELNKLLKKKNRKKGT